MTIKYIMSFVKKLFTWRARSIYGLFLEDWGCDAEKTVTFVPDKSPGDINQSSYT